MNTTKILNTYIDHVTWSEAISRLVNMGTKRESKIVCACNVHMLSLAQKDKDLERVLLNSEMVIPDGAPIAWAVSKIRKLKQDRISGPDLMWSYLKEAEIIGHVVFFLGGDNLTLTNLRKKIINTFPNLKIGGMISPPFHKLSAIEDKSYISLINEAKTNTLFVGLGCPKQEKWMENHRGLINSTMVGVGAAFDFYAGTIKRAPTCIQSLGFEWSFRLFSEPKRLWKRYFFTNIFFIINVAFPLLLKGRIK